MPFAVFWSNEHFLLYPMYCFRHRPGKRLFWFVENKSCLLFQHFHFYCLYWLFVSWKIFKNFSLFLVLRKTKRKQHANISFTMKICERRFTCRLASVRANRLLTVRRKCLCVVIWIAFIINTFAKWFLRCHYSKRWDIYLNFFF